MVNLCLLFSPRSDFSPGNQFNFRFLNKTLYDETRAEFGGGSHKQMEYVGWSIEHVQHCLGYKNIFYPSCCQQIENEISSVFLSATLDGEHLFCYSAAIYAKHWNFCMSCVSEKCTRKKLCVCSPLRKGAGFSTSLVHWTWIWKGRTRIIKSNTCHLTSCKSFVVEGLIKLVLDPAWGN